MPSSKKLLQAAAGSAGGAEALNVEDVFSTYLYEGNGSSQVIENGINLGQSYGSGSANFNGTDERVDISSATNLQIGSSDFTLEMFFFLKEAPSTFDILALKGFNSQNSREYGFEFSGSSGIYWLYSTDGTGWTLPQVVTSGLTVGVWHHLAVSRSGSNLSVWFNGTRTYNDASHASTYHTGTDNFLIAGYNDGTTNAYYSPAYFSNLRLVKGSAVYNPSSTSITVPTSELSNVANTSLLTLQGSTPFTDNSSSSHTLSLINSPTASTFGPFDAAAAGEGGLVWIKNRSDGGIYRGANIVFDTERGVGKRLYTNGTDAEFQQNSTNGHKSFNANGFTLGTDDASGNYGINYTGDDYASWTFRKAPKFFDVVTYTGTGSATTISHNLGSVPACIIVKRTDSTENWKVYHRAIHPTNNGSGYVINLNLTNARAATTIWSSTEPTSTEFSISGSSTVNASGGTYVAYLFAHNDGDGEFGPTGDQDIIKCGSFTTNSDGSLNLVDLGFEPQWLLIKNSASTGDWQIHDTMRDGTLSARLFPNTSAAEASYSSQYLKVEPTGFSAVAGWGGISKEKIYIAIRRGPMGIPESATDVFQPITYTADGTNSRSITASGMQVDEVIISTRNLAQNHGWYSRTRGNGSNLATNLSSSETATVGNLVAFDTNDGFNITNAGAGNFNVNAGSFSMVAHALKRAPNFFDVVAYSAQSGDLTVPHNLGVTPEMIWIKPRNYTGNWTVWHSGLSTGTASTNYVIYLNKTDAESGPNANIVSYSDTNFVVGNARTATNNTALSGEYIAYLFASVDGVSKVGSYTGNAGASTINVDCGFTNGARFVLIKESSGTGDWWVFDTARGLVAGNDAALKLNTTDAETSADYIDPYSGGFSLQTNSGINTNGATFIFYAVA